MTQLDWTGIFRENGFIQSKEFTYLNKKFNIGCWIGTIHTYNWVCYISELNEKSGKNVHDKKEFLQEFNRITKTKKP